MNKGNCHKNNGYLVLLNGVDNYEGRKMQQQTFLIQSHDGIHIVTLNESFISNKWQVKIINSQNQIECLSGVTADKKELVSINHVHLLLIPVLQITLKQFYLPACDCNLNSTSRYAWTCHFESLCTTREVFSFSESWKYFLL